MNRTIAASIYFFAGLIIPILSDLAWAQEERAERDELASYETRLAELRGTEVSLDTAAITTSRLGALLGELDTQRTWAQTCVRETEEAVINVTEEITLLGEPTPGEDVRVNLERTRIGNQLRVLETQLGGCRLLIVRTKKLIDKVLTLQSGRARKTLLTRSEALWEFDSSAQTSSRWLSWADEVSQNDLILESLLLILLLSLGGLVLAYGGKRTLGRLPFMGVSDSHLQSSTRQRRYYLHVLRENLPSLTVGCILWAGTVQLTSDLGAPLISLAQLCLALSLTLSIEELWRFRRKELTGSQLQVPAWKPVIFTTALLLFSLNPINTPAISALVDSLLRTLLFGLLFISLFRLKQTWQPQEALYQTALNLSFFVTLVCLGAEILGFRNLSSTLFDRFAYANLGFSLTLTAVRGISNALTRWSEQTKGEETSQETEQAQAFLSGSGTWVEFTISVSLWTIFGLYLFTLLGYADQGFSALERLTVDGFAIGEFQFVPGRIIFALIVLYSLLTFSRWFRNIFESRWVKSTSMDRGARDAVITFLGYIGTSASVIAALVVAGIDFTGLAILFSALSVGIGFGLQNVVNNFVSGLILLFERPIKSGDWVSVGSTEGHVKKIRIRSTLIQTLDRADVIVPNSELISAQVTNWMLRDRIGRVKVAIGVAYGSDTALVKKLLIDIATSHPEILTSPKMHEPTVTFTDFGASSLDFTLRVFIPDIERRFVIASDLRFAIDEAFRKHAIEIPFPQRDLHIRTGELPVTLKSEAQKDKDLG